MNLSYPENLYIGFKKQDDMLLGFIADDTSTHDTVDRWRDKSIETKIITNEPIEGFKLYDLTRRYSTSNVFFEIQDPRGFILQISSENLLFITDKIGIEKGGIISGKCYWTIASGKAFLCSDEMGFLDILLLKRTTKPIKISEAKYEIGTRYWLSSGTEQLTYQGVVYRYYGWYKMAENDIVTYESKLHCFIDNNGNTITRDTKSFSYLKKEQGTIADIDNIVAELNENNWKFYSKTVILTQPKIVISESSYNYDLVETNDAVFIHTKYDYRNNGLIGIKASKDILIDVQANWKPNLQYGLVNIPNDSIIKKYHTNLCWL